MEKTPIAELIKEHATEWTVEMLLGASVAIETAARLIEKAQGRNLNESDYLMASNAISVIRHFKRVEHVEDFLGILAGVSSEFNTDEILNSEIRDTIMIECATEYIREEIGDDDY